MKRISVGIHRTLGRIIPPVHSDADLDERFVANGKERVTLKHPIIEKILRLQKHSTVYSSRRMRARLGLRYLKQ